MLTGHIAAAPNGAHGFDCNTKLDAGNIRKFKELGFAFVIRYVGRGEDAASHDLDSDEANAILDGGLALMAVQHVEKEPWKPSETKGETYGRQAAAHAQAIGFPSGVNIWLDLEGINRSVSAETVIQYCNAWFREVAAAGYVPGVYVGANAILDGDQLYWDLRTQYYWRSGSRVPEITKRGYCMVQRINGNDKIDGVSIDRDLVTSDAFGNTPLWLIRNADEDGDVPEDISHVLLSTLPTAAGNPLAVTTKMPSNATGLTHYNSEERLYGTSLTIAALVEVGRIWTLRRPAGSLAIGDISQKGGGAISGHASHRKGIDLDMRMMKADGIAAKMVYTSAAYSRAVTQELVDLFYGNGVLAVQLVFFNDAEVAGVQHWPNHDDHLHVRFHVPGTQSAFPTLTHGSQGPAVRELQRRLGFWAVSSGNPAGAPSVDGDFGNITGAAVTAFQTALHLPGSGIADEATWAALPVA